MTRDTAELYGRGLWDGRIWIGLGIAFAVLGLADVSEPRSHYWASSLVLYGLMVLGLWAHGRHRLRKRLRIPRNVAPLSYVVLVWFFGMVFEAGLSITGEGIGGLHPETLPSFILAQGDYVPIALVTLLVIRSTGAGCREVFFFAGGKGLTEGLIFVLALGIRVVWGLVYSPIVARLFDLPPNTAGI